MTNDEIAEVISKGQKDGGTLYRVSDALYKIAIFFNWIIAIFGLILTFFAGSKSGMGVALIVLLCTLLTCAIGYAFAVLGSHVSKVLVHILFSNLAILDRGSK